MCFQSSDSVWLEANGMRHRVPRRRVPRQFPDSPPTVPPQFSDNFRGAVGDLPENCCGPTVPRQSPDSSPTVLRQFPDSSPTVTCLLLRELYAYARPVSASTTMPRSAGHRHTMVRLLADQEDTLSLANGLQKDYMIKRTPCHCCSFL